MSVHTAVARNFAVETENKIHSDGIAKRFGFRGGLVPGVAVFGHLAAPLTQRHGLSWLERSLVTTRFLKPAYHGEALTVIDSENAVDRFSVECKNAAGMLLATLECSLDQVDAPVDAHARMNGPAQAAPRVEITWETVHVEEPFASYLWTPDHDHNREYAARVADTTDSFQQGVLHPHALLSQANQVLVRQFIMPAWIHTGSEIRFRRLLRVGDEIEVRAVPLEKWEKKGHQFIKLYLAYVVRGQVATEIFHTAIFRVAEKSATTATE